MSTPAEQLTPELRAVIRERLRQRLQERMQAQPQQREPVPIEPPPQPRAQTFGGTGPQSLIPEFTALVTPPDPLAQARPFAEQGIQFDQPAPPEAVDRLALGFAPGGPTGDFAGNEVRKQLTAFFGQPIQVNRKNDQFTFVDPTGRERTLNDLTRDFTKAKLKQQFGPSIPAFGGFAGGTIGAFGGPGTAVAGSGAGGAFGEAIRLMIGKQLGVHDLDETQIAKQALTFGGLEASFEVGGNLVARLSNLIRAIRNPVDKLPRADAERILETLVETEQIVQRFNARTRELGGDEAQQLRPTVPQLAEDADLTRDLEAAQRGNFPLQRVSAERERLNDRALQEFGERILPSDPEGAAAQRAGQALAKQQRTENAAVEARLGREQRTVKTEAGREVDTIDMLQPDEAGLAARTAFERELQILKGQEARDWLNFNVRLGIDEQTLSSPHRVPIEGTPIAELAAKLQTIQERALTRAERQQAAALRSRDIDVAAGLVDEAEDAAGILGADGQVLRAFVDDTKDGAVDLAQIERALRATRNMQRLVTSGQAGIRFDQKLLSDMEKALDRTMVNYIRETDPDALNLLSSARHSSRVKNDLLDKTLLGRYFVESSGRLQVRNKQVFDELFSRQNLDAWREMGRLIERNGSARLPLQQAVWSHYRRNAIPEGSNIPDLALHRKWLQTHGELAKEIFSPEEATRLTKFGGFAELIADKTRRFERSMGAIEATARRRGRIVNANNPTAMLKELLSADTAGGRQAFSLTDIKRIKALAGRAGILPELQEALRAELYRKTTSGGRFSLTAVRNTLRDRTPVIRELLGKQYLQDLNTFERALTVNRRVPGGMGSQVEGLDRSLIALTRIYTRALSRKGLALTAGRIIFQQNVDRMMFDILSDPDALRSFIALHKRNVRDKQVMQFLARTGAVALVDESLLRAAELAGSEPEQETE